ncbi:MAG: hypothetical protein MMC33_004995 [Icmadophila ericetorum]|nr:hypothetical protein [Icmadophila ericetorum]
MDPLSLAGVIGTWVAVGLAVVALVGIVGPLILLRERSGANATKLSIPSIARTLDTPEMNPPNPEKYFRGTNRLQHFDNAGLQEENSKTGWVNLAAIIDAYTSDVPKGDVLIIHQKQSWLPVHRFWLLAFGRLMIEEDEDENDGWGPVQALSSYMAPREQYGGVDHARTIYPDPIPLAQLFWLALGCLPLGSGKDDIVFDLADFEPSYESRRLGLGPPTQNFYRFKARGSLGISGVHRKWAEAMGVDLEKLYCIQRVDFPSDWVTAVASANVNKGPWFRPSGHSEDYLWRSDVHRQILGLLHMHVGPEGVLFDYSRYGPYLSTLSTHEKAVLERMRKLWLQNELASNGQPNPRFSRKEAQASYDFDIPDTLLLEIEIVANCIKTKSTSGALMEHTVVFSEVFANNLPGYSPIQTRYTDQTVILLSALNACVRAFCFRILLDSSKLIRLIQRMDEIVHVAASSRIPVLLATESTRRFSNGRRRFTGPRSPASYPGLNSSRPLTIPHSHFATLSPDIGFNVSIPSAVVPGGNTAALMPQDGSDNEFEEHGSAINDRSAQPSLLRRWSLPLLIDPGSEEAMRFEEMEEQEAREPYRERDHPYGGPEVRHENTEQAASVRMSRQESPYQRRLSPTLTVTSDYS